MCLSYAWKYNCGCIAPKPAEGPIYRCTLWELGKACQIKQLFSYLNVNCSLQCRWTTESDERYIPRSDDTYLYTGPYHGEPTEEDYFFGRVKQPIVVPFYNRSAKRRDREERKRACLRDERRAVMGGEGFGTEDPEMAVIGTLAALGLSDEVDPGLGLDSDLVVDEYQPAEHSANTKFGRCSRRKK